MLSPGCVASLYRRDLSILGVSFALPDSFSLSVRTVSKNSLGTELSRGDFSPRNNISAKSIVKCKL